MTMEVNDYFYYRVTCLQNRKSPQKPNKITVNIKHEYILISIITIKIWLYRFIYTVWYLGIFQKMMRQFSTLHAFYPSVTLARFNKYNNIKNIAISIFAIYCDPTNNLRLQKSKLDYTYTAITKNRGLTYFYQ